MDFGARPDGSRKGNGFFGVLKRPDGNVSTELSAEADVDGKRLLYPLLVPTLKRSHIDHLLRGGEPTDEMHDIAIKHALERQKAGKSPFAGAGENGPLPEPDNMKDAIKRGLGMEAN